MTKNVVSGPNVAALAADQCYYQVLLCELFQVVLRLCMRWASYFSI